MTYFLRLFDLMVGVMLPVTLLVGAGAMWTRWFPDTHVEHARTLLNRLAMYLFYPSILYAVAATTPINADLLTVPLLVGLGSLTSGLILYLLLYRAPLWPHLTDPARAGIMLGGMFGNTFNIGVPVLIFFYGREATRYAVFNDILMTMPFVWSLGVWIATRLGSHTPVESYPSIWRVMISMPPIWAFVLGFGTQQLGLTYQPLVNATWFIGQATIPVTLLVLGLTIPWRNLVPRSEILSAAMVKLLVTPIVVWCAAWALFSPMGEAQYAAVVEATTPPMLTALLLADRFRLDAAATALLIGWATILFWVTLPIVMALQLIR